MNHRFIALLLLSVFVLAVAMSAKLRAEESPAAGATRVARWKDDKQAAFLLMFDDSAPTAVRNVVPELNKRDMIGTFYVNPGKGEWKALAKAWEKEIPAMGMEYANHTMTHKGVRDMENAEEEIGKCNDVILGLFADMKKPRLISFGQPGVAKGAWNISDEQLATLLAKHHLIDRGPFHGHGATIHFRTAGDIMKLVDKAIKAGSLEYVVFHGVGGDWIVFPLDEFTTLLDKLAAKRDQLWITGHIAAHKYATEHDSAEAKVLEAGDKQIRISLTCKADTALYDASLTLVTQVPRAWDRCDIRQADKATTMPVKNGVVMYQAMPNGEAIVLTRAKLDAK